MNKENFEIFLKNFSGETTEQENKTLYSNLQDNPGFKAEFESFNTLWEKSANFKNIYNSEKGYELLQKKIRMRTRKTTILLRIAAIFIGLFLVSAYLLNDANRVTNIVATNKVLSITLPDSSKIFLNKGASLSYTNPRIMPFKRKVNLDGEGFFEITPDVNHPFVVSTQEFDVQVLGTKFNVNTSAKESKIILTEGKVRLMNFTNKHNEMYMSPGDMISVNRESRAVTESQVNPELFTIWKDKRIIFNYFSLEEITQIIQNVFGKEVKINNNTIINKHLYGSAPVDDLQVLLQALAEILNQEVYLENDTVIIN